MDSTDLTNCHADPGPVVGRVDVKGPSPYSLNSNEPEPRIATIEAMVPVIFHHEKLIGRDKHRAKLSRRLGDQIIALRDRSQVRFVNHLPVYDGGFRAALNGVPSHGYHPLNCQYIKWWSLKDDYIISVGKMFFVVPHICDDSVAAHDGWGH